VTSPSQRSNPARASRADNSWQSSVILLIRLDHAYPHNDSLGPRDTSCLLTNNHAKSTIREFKLNSVGNANTQSATKRTSTTNTATRSRHMLYLHISPLRAPIRRACPPISRLSTGAHVPKTLKSASKHQTRKANKRPRGPLQQTRQSPERHP